MSKGQTRQLAGATLARYPQLRVTVEKGADSGKSVIIEQAPVILGGAPTCELSLGDDTVSARHCELVPCPGGLLIRDLGSTNGVRVGTVRVLEAILEVGMRFQLGRTQLRVDAAGEGDVVLSREGRFGATLYGQSPVMRALFAQLESLAGSNEPLLVEGEPGTGKDVTAEALHQASPRADGPYVVFDCGALAPDALEAELFGREARAGAVESAQGGTLMLEEVGELPLELQPRLLRLIERGEVRRVGSAAVKAVDVRVIACTQRALRPEVKAGRFREDLYARLSAQRIRLPALRERMEDLPGLVDHLFQQQGSRRRFEDLPEGDQQMLRAHRWPGNIRELRSVVERLLAGTEPTRLSPQIEEVVTQPSLDRPDAEELHGDGPGGAAFARELLPLSVARERAQDEFERGYLSELLNRSGGSISEAGRIAGVSRQFLQRLLRKHGLR